MKKAQKNEPSLRFPEFSGAWSANVLDFYIKKIGDPILIDKNESYKEIGIRSHGKGVFHKAPVTGYSLGNKRVFSVHVPAFVVNIVFAWEHAVALTSDKENGFIASHRFPMFVPVDKRSDLPFVLYFFLRKYGKHLLGLASPGGAGRNKTLGKKNFDDLKVIFPSLQEQQKIAEFLTAVDTKIEQISKKKSLLEQYKKGVMQRLFGQELRFKDEGGGDYPDWEEKRLGDFYGFKSTNSLSRDKLNYENGEIYNLHYGDIHTKFKSKFILLEENVPFIKSDVNLSGISKDKYCMRGDLVIADASEDYADIGKAIELVDLSGQKVLSGLHTLLARLSSKDIFIGYGAFVMACYSVRHQIKVIAQGTKVLGLSAGRVGNIKLPIPSVEEQQKIADFLSAIDQKIDLVAAELVQAQMFKRGLLQQMFV